MSENQNPEQNEWRAMVMGEQDIRWKQRLANFNKALSQLKKFIERGELNELEEQGLVQAFEYTYELAWNVVRDYLRAQGNQDIHGSRDAIREAFNLELIRDGEGWMEMLKDRNLTAHTYNEETARAIAEHVSTRYYDLFAALQQTMQGIAEARSRTDG